MKSKFQLLREENKKNERNETCFRIDGQLTTNGNSNIRSRNTTCREITVPFLIRRKKEKKIETVQEISVKITSKVNHYVSRTYHAAHQKII